MAYGKALFGLRTDLGLTTGNRFAFSSSIFFLGYLVRTALPYRYHRSLLTKRTVRCISGNPTRSEISDGAGFVVYDHGVGYMCLAHNSLYQLP